MDEIEIISSTALLIGRLLAAPNPSGCLARSFYCVLNASPPLPAAVDCRGYWRRLRRARPRRREADSARLWPLSDSISPGGPIELEPLHSQSALAMTRAQFTAAQHAARHSRIGYQFEDTVYLSREFTDAD